GGGDLAFHEQRRLEARLVLVARHEQRGHGKPSQLRFELEDRRGPTQHAEHRHGLAPGPMILPLLAKNRPAWRVLAPERQTGWPAGVDLGKARDPLRAQQLNRTLDIAQKALAIDGARASADDHDPITALRVAHREVQYDVAAHGEANQVGSLDPQMVEYAEQVADQQVLRIRLRIGGHTGRRKPAVAVGNTPVQSTKGTHLRIPGAVVASE